MELHEKLYRDCLDSFRDAARDANQDICLQFVSQEAAKTFYITARRLLGADLSDGEAIARIAQLLEREQIYLGF